ncbi:uncharacterized [Tachysurus ichikawai]
MHSPSSQTIVPFSFSLTFSPFYQGKIERERSAPAPVGVQALPPSLSRGPRSVLGVNESLRFQQTHAT